MKLLVLSCLLTISLSATAQQMKPFTISGKISSIPYKVDKIFLYYRLAGDARERVDSSAIVNEQYTLKGFINEPVWSFATVRMFDDNGNKVKWDNERDCYNLFLEPTNINISSVNSLGNTKITGLVYDSQFRLLEPAKSRFWDESGQAYGKLLDARKKNDTVLAKKMQEDFAIINQQYYTYIHDFIKKYPASPIALWGLNEYASFGGGGALESIESTNKIEDLFNLLNPQVKKNPTGVELKKRIDNSKKTTIGAYATNFSQADTSGKKISLASFRGKYILLDFWASWCAPCRADNPNLVKVYNQYKDKGFTILSVSLDKKEDKEAWLKAIRQDNLIWTHVSDLQYWDNAVAKLYAVKSVPKSFLIDKEGKIVAKNLTGNKLEKKLKELLD